MFLLSKSSWSNEGDINVITQFNKSDDRNTKRTKKKSTVKIPFKSSIRKLSKKVREGKPYKIFKTCILKKINSFTLGKYWKYIH